MSSKNRIKRMCLAIGLDYEVVLVWVLVCIALG